MSFFGRFIFVEMAFFSQWYSFIFSDIAVLRGELIA